MGFDAAEALSSALSTSAISDQISVGVIKAVQNLDKNVAAELFSSIGLGQNVDLSG